MLSIASVVSTAGLLALSLPHANAHGYMLIPQSQFSGTASGAWIVQIDPVWSSDKWNGNTQASVDAFKSLKTANNYVDLKTLMDDTSTYGADCGFTNPNGTPQPIPTDGKATFERAIQHVGPCEIWLDDKKVFYEDDCYSTYGNEDVSVKSQFPVDYSTCNSGGCKEMRFYWLAFQGLDGKTVWQSYKDCIPLKGSGGGTSQTPSSSSVGGEAESTPQSIPSTGSSTNPSTNSNASATQAPASINSPSTDSQTPSADTPEVTPAPSTKCNGRKQRH